jgi:ABC-type glutathione transport system ATPase component
MSTSTTESQATPPSAAPLVSARGLCVAYSRRHGRPHSAVQGVDLDIARGETLALLGESGCGKTSLAKALVGLVARAAGTVRFDGAELARLRGRKRLHFRRRAQLIFQDASASLNPRMRVRDIVADPLRVHRTVARNARIDRACDVLVEVGLPTSLADRYPHELSGGERQRVALARALVLQPELLICDEPLSALDASARVRMFHLLAALQREGGRTFLFITHDPAAASRLANRVAIMYAGRIVETGPLHQVFREPQHPYTVALLSAIPRLDRAQTTQTS